VLQVHGNPPRGESGVLNIQGQNRAKLSEAPPERLQERKPVKWLGTTLNDIRDLSDDIQDQLGYQLDRVQLGLMPNNYKNMKLLVRASLRFACPTPTTSHG
jgi:hypothetical protein